MGKRTYLWMVSIVAAFGGLLFGYDAVVVSGTNSQVSTQFDFTPAQLGFYVSCVLWGCMLGSGVAGWVADHLGRKKTLMTAAFLIFISAFWSGLAVSVPQLITARLIGGIGIGAATMVCPLYISEISPEKYRGRMVTLFQLTITIGIVMCVFANWGIFGFAEKNQGLALAGSLRHKLVVENWRLMFMAESLPGLIFLISAFFLPESPRWLVKQQQKELAEKILARVNSRERAAEVVSEIEGALQEEGSLRFRDLFSRRLKKPLLISLTEAMKVAGMAEAHYIDLMPHNPIGSICTAASIHLAASVPNFSWLEEVNTPAQNMLTNDPVFYPLQPKLEGPRYIIPKEPGLGVDFNEELALNQKFKPVEIPRLRRSDGSYTNW